MKQHFTRVLVVVLFAVFSLPVWAGLLTQRTQVNDYGGPYYNYEFGSTGVAISDDGLSFVIASPGMTWGSNILGDGTGSGQVFQYLNAKWTNTSGLWTSGPTTAAGYGTGLAMSADGSAVLLGFGQSCKFNMAPTGCSPAYVNVQPTVSGQAGVAGSFLDPTSSQNFTSNFGQAGALSHDGHVALVGAPGASVGSANSAGQVIVYAYNGSTWTGTTISDPAAHASDGFGVAVALSADGHTALIGAYGDGSGGGEVAYLYTLSAQNTWTKTQTFNGVYIYQGCLALSAGGQSAIISTDTGANIYTSANSWAPTSISGPNGSGDGSVAMAADGSSVLIGTTGAVDQYTLSSSGWGGVRFFADPVANSGSGFGQTGVALSADKETMVVTAGDADVTSGGYTYKDAGTAYVYQSPADLSLTATATPSKVVLQQQTTLAFAITNKDSEVTAYNVVMTDILPTGFSDIVADGGNNGNCIVNDQTVTCVLSSLTPGAVWNPVIYAVVRTAGEYTDTASVTSNQPDPDISNNKTSMNIGMVPPTVTDGGLTVIVSTTGSGGLTGTNPCNCGTLTYSIVQQPAHGRVEITDANTGAFSYTPNPGYLGFDSFTFQLTNGFSTSTTATESITFKDAPPTAKTLDVNTMVNQPVSGVLSATPGYTGQTLSYVIATRPTHGAVTVTAATGAFTYTPDDGYSGSDNFSFTAGDGQALSTTASVNITVKDIAPTASSGNANTMMNQPVTGTLSATPAYSGQTLKFNVVSMPAHGSVTNDSSTGKFTYTPASGYSGSDSFTFTVGDGTLTSSPATESVAVKAAVGSGGGGGAAGLFVIGLLGGLLALVRRRR